MEFHESWNDPAFDHDICIITVKEGFNFDDPNVQPIEFFKGTDAEIPPETICNSTGWGLTNGAGGISSCQTLHTKYNMMYFRPLPAQPSAVDPDSNPLQRGL